MSQNVDENEEYELVDKDKIIKNFNSASIDKFEIKNEVLIDSNSNNSGVNKINNKTKNNKNNENNNQMLSNQIILNENLSPNSNNSRNQDSKSTTNTKISKIQKKFKTFAKTPKFILEDVKNNIYLIKKDSTNHTHEIFVELEQLTLIDQTESIYEWREVSRWIKYEQSIEPETNIWSKPYVGALVYQSLLYLKTGLQYGTVLLKCDKDSVNDIVDEMIQDFIESGHMNKENRDLVKKTLLSNHRHTSNFVFNNNTNPSSMRKKSTISEFFPISYSRRQSTFTGDNLNQFNINSEQPSACNSRKNSSVQSSDLNLNQKTPKNQNSKNKKLSISEYNLESNSNKSHQLTKMPNRENSVKFFVPSNNASSDDNNLHNTSNHKHRRRSTIALLKNTLTQTKLNKSELNIKGVSSDAEVCKILVGIVDYLDRPVMGFVRLINSQLMDDFVESQIKVRFLFVLLGPKNENIDYIEIGRCIGTLMTNKEFHSCAYKANDRRDLIEGISYFTNKSLCLVLPLGDFDNDLLSPILDWVKIKLKRKLDKLLQDKKNNLIKKELNQALSPVQSNKSKKDANNNLADLSSNSKHVNSKLLENHNHSQEEEKSFSNNLNQNDDQFDPFQRTGYLFGSLVKEIKYRYSKYISDFKDALNIHCLIAFIFIFTVCIATSLSFGGILADKTDKWFGVNEMLLATSLNGIISGLLSGQPLMILGPTGPFLVFEEMLFLFCQKVCIEFLALRCWVAMWVLIFALIMLAFESVYIIKYVTRFTEEIFAFLIATVFLTDAIKKIVKIFKQDPVYTTNYYCSSSSSFLENTIKSKNNSLYDLEKECYIYIKDDLESINEINKIPRPNIALLSLILLIGTCCMALSLKKLRKSIFLGARVRRTLSDVGMLISIILMVIVDSLIKSSTGLETPKLDIPNSLKPTKHRENWFVSPFGVNIELFPIWVPFASIFPAFLIFVVLFFEIELTGMILYAKQRKLKKGTGFNLDLLISAILMNINSLFGLPWMCAAPVRTLAHWASLTVYSKTYIPGEKPKLIDVKEQRLTNICVHLAIGLCLLAKSALKMIPISVLFGIFLYFGIVSLSGTQLYERIKLIFIPSKYCPNAIYARGVRPSKRNLYTFIQIIFILILILIKSFSSFSYTFPIVLFLLVPLRIYILPNLFTHKELEQLDNHDELTNDIDSTLDFYELTHLPI